MTIKKATDHLTKQVTNAKEKVVEPLVDLILGKTMSKKLLVFFLATIFILRNVLTGDQWVTVAEWYFGSQGAVDVTEAIVGRYKHKKLNQNPEQETP